MAAVAPPAIIQPAAIAYHINGGDVETLSVQEVDVPSEADEWVGFTRIFFYQFSPIKIAMLKLIYPGNIAKAAQLKNIVNAGWKGTES